MGVGGTSGGKDPERLKKTKPNKRARIFSTIKKMGKGMQ